MELVILVIHIFLAAAIIGVILLQPPESSSLGGLGGSNPMAGVASRSQGNILTRATGILATAFIVTSLVLAIISGQKPKHASILDQVQTQTQEQTQAAESDAPAADVEQTTEETAPAVPSVPLSK